VWTGPKMGASTSLAVPEHRNRAGRIRMSEENVFDVGLNLVGGDTPFARQLPFFNWFYPFDLDGDRASSALVALGNVAWSSIRRCAVYIHIPFCDTICTFCPFTRGKYGAKGEVNDYVDAVIREIQLKRSYVGKLHVDSVFIGGGTPSVLEPAQILKLGDCVSTYFDMTKTTEFAVEVEVKSVTPEKLRAFRQIGVNRVSFGVQTFSKPHRSVLRLDAELLQIKRTAEWVNGLFPYTNVDMIYGMAGQEIDDVIKDADCAIQLGTTSIDFYPLNNLAAQIRMHTGFKAEGFRRLNAAERLDQRGQIARHMLARNYHRINGYGYALGNGAPSGIIQTTPKFLYHDILYGYSDDAVVGYGSSAITHAPGYNVYNAAGRAEYVEGVLGRNTLPCSAFAVRDSSEKGVVMFPYRGAVHKGRVPWASVPCDTADALRELIRSGLVKERPATLEVTELGWLFYVNLMYFLMPHEGKVWISKRIAARIAAGHECELTELH
jgi:coproporphyrinogen III oxidase-like Fe-S oxidoreductase